jgi:hypothetical protein
MKKSKITHRANLSRNQKNACITFCFLLSVFLFLLASCKKKSISISTVSSIENSVSNDEIDDQEKANMPEFLFENLSCNFGEVIQGEKVNYAFHFKNVGKSTLIIYDVETSCGCTTTLPLKKPIEPEETGEISISFDTERKSGDVIIYVVVTANTNPMQTILTINANVLKQ